MLGNNPKRPPVKGDGHTLDVQEIFPTLQGEGPFAGHPAIFIRLGGCNLACKFCDTEFESFQTHHCDQILSTIEQLNTQKQFKLIVITGGEPFRQPIEYLCQALLNAHYQIQIETNGTLYRPLPDNISIVCSPKPSKEGYHPIRPDLLPMISAFKFIISTTRPNYDKVTDIGQRAHHIPVYVQPMDEYDDAQNIANVKHARDLALQHGYRLSLQLHKILDIP